MKFRIDLRIAMRMHQDKLLRGVSLVDAVEQALIEHYGLDPDDFPSQQRNLPRWTPPRLSNDPQAQAARATRLQDITKITKCRQPGCGAKFATGMHVHCPAHRDPNVRYKLDHTIVCPACNKDFEVAKGERRILVSQYGRRFKRQCPSCWSQRVRDQADGKKVPPLYPADYDSKANPAPAPTEPVSP